MMLQRKAEDFAKELGTGKSLKAATSDSKTLKLGAILFSGNFVVKVHLYCKVFLKIGKKTYIPSLVKGYKPIDIFNVEEVGLFFSYH